MAQAWTQERVLQLSPDPASTKAGQGLANIRKWVSVGCDARVAWGECQGSGSKPYQTQFDLNEAASKCSCPSRKFPCKHALGLMLIYSSAANAVKEQAAPAWVEEWIAGRAEKAKKKQEKAEAPPKPVDEEAQAQRREKRLARVAEGLASLKTWSQDMLRSGIATVGTKGFAFFDEPARRLIDAQAPGLARRVQMLGETTALGAGWQRMFLERLASIYLLIRGFESIEALPEATRQDIYATLGLPQKTDDPAAPAPVRDTWQVIAQEVDVQEKLRVQRTWLTGVESGRPALILAFAHGNTPLDITLAPSMCFEGELAFYPGNGVRAEVKLRDAVRPIQTLEGHASLEAFCAWAGEHFARQPWLGELAAPLRGVTPVLEDGQWTLVDGQQRALPATISGDAGWLALAMSGGHPVDMVVGFDGRRLRPMAMVAGGEYVSLRANQSEGH